MALMTSRYEGLPLVLLEAKSWSLPVVAYDCPTGPQEIINHGADGFLVLMNDKAAFLARMEQLGRLDHQKGFDLLLDIWADFSKKHPEWTLAIAGDGELRQQLHEQAAALGITNSVNFVGKVSNINDYYIAINSFSKPIKLMKWLLLRYYDRVIVLTDKDQQVFSRWHIRSQQIPNPVVYKGFERRQRSRQALAVYPFTHVKEIVSFEGHSNPIKSAVARIHQEGFDSVFLISMGRLSVMFAFWNLMMLNKKTFKAYACEHVQSCSQ
ncbi:hypothetical protein CRX72_21980 [Pantoea sp. BRM17]|nr:hypothetical protein CRX72_21980 [Pantoea sp. BRM17]